MLFLAYCLDGAQGPELRQQHLPSHLEWVATVAEHIRLAGPLRDEQEAPIGSVLIVEAENREHAEALLASDPYRKVGLWQSVTVHAFMARAGTWLA